MSNPRKKHQNKTWQRPRVWRGAAQGPSTRPTSARPCGSVLPICGSGRALPRRKLQSSMALVGGLLPEETLPGSLGISCLREGLYMFRLSWKWRERPTVKITERTLEKRTEVLHRGREGRHPEAAFAGTTAGLEAM